MCYPIMGPPTYWSPAKRVDARLYESLVWGIHKQAITCGALLFYMLSRQFFLDDPLLIRFEDAEHEIPQTSSLSLFNSIILFL